MDDQFEGDVFRANPLAKSRRYVVVYKRLIGSSVETLSARIGPFDDADTADRRAKAHFYGPGTEILSVKPETPFQSATHVVTRFLIRSMRMAVGIVIAVVAWAFLYGDSTGVGDIPFSQLTISMLFGAIMKFAFAMAVAWMAWMIAFGPAPDEIR